MEGTIALEQVAHQGLLRIAMIASMLRAGLIVITAVMLATAAASPPSVIAFGYARETFPGIPPTHAAANLSAGRTGLPTEYFIYVEVAAGSHVSVNWTSVRGRYYHATIEKISTPVLIDLDAAVPTGKQETLVPKSKNDVYSVVLGNEMVRAPLDDARTQTLVHQNDAVVYVTIDDSAAFALTKSLKALPPKAGM
jgi:hypothetical protein